MRTTILTAALVASVTLVAAPTVAAQESDVLVPPLGCDVVGTDGDDHFPSVEGGSTVCGLGGNDTVLLLADGTFIGGTGDDMVDAMTSGVFHGGEGDDLVDAHVGGTFNGGNGND